MSRSQADLELVLRARDLATNVVHDFGTAVGGLGVAAQRASSKVGAAFRSVSSGITNGLGNLTESLAQGAGLGEAMFMFGTYMAGQAAEAMVGGLIEKLAGSSLIQAVGAPIAAAMSSLGGVMAAAIPVGMALLPVLLVGAIVAAIVFLINNPQIVDQILSFAGTIVRGIIDGLVALPGLLLDFFGAALGAVVDAVGPYVAGIVDWFLGIPGKLVNLGASIVGTIIGGLVSLPGKVADVVRDAFAKLKIDIGPFHIRSTGVTIDLPNIGGPEYTKNRGTLHGHHRGGWVGLNGPELGLLGERGPEYVIPADRARAMAAGQGGAGGGGVPGELVLRANLYLDGRQVAESVSRHQYRQARRQPATG